MVTILGIETTCDETAVALVRRNSGESIEIIGSLVASQIDLHRAYGGVVPELAARAHVEKITALLDSLFKETDFDRNSVDAIAVANRPGLIGALLVGVGAAKALAWAWDKPLVDVDHIQAHLYSSILAGMPAVPHVALVASGGHTSLYHVTGTPPPLGNIVRLGSTTDDAAGEAFDKVAQILGLDYPGGPAIQKAAAGGNPKAYRFPRSRVKEDNYDFSFSGVKTSVLYKLRGGQGNPGPAARIGVGRELKPEEIRDAAASFQEAVAEVLAAKTIKAAKNLGVSWASFNGGVACNARLREVAKSMGVKKNVNIFFPPPQLCTDNAAMIAGLGIERFLQGIRSGLDMEAIPSGYPYETMKLNK
jgi:N6-L-threonylcarbamoyladenine synthase